MTITDEIQHPEAVEYHFHFNSPTEEEPELNKDMYEGEEW